MLDKIKNLSELLSNMGTLREKMEEVKKRIASIRVVGDAGAGMVTVTATGEGQVTNVFINKKLFDSDDNKMLEDLVMAATNDALKKSERSDRLRIPIRIRRFGFFRNFQNVWRKFWLTIFLKKW